MLAGEIRIPSSTTVTVTDSHSPSGRSVTLTAGYYRTLLAQSAGTGTQASPWELLSRLSTLVNAAPGSTYYTFSLGSDGFVKCARSSAGSGASSIAGTNVLRLLGFDATISFSAPSQTVVAAYHPQFVLYSTCCAGDSGWTSRTPMAAAAETLDGRVVGWMDPTVRVTRSFDLRFHPRAWSDRSGDVAATPVEPPKARWRTPATALGSVLHWSVRDFVHAAAFKRMGLAINNFQAYIGGLSPFDVGYFTESSLSTDKAIVPTTPNWNARCDWRGIELVYRETMNRT
jgi:hypothetical protein